MSVISNDEQVDEAPWEEVYQLLSNTQKVEQEIGSLVHESRGCFDHKSKTKARLTVGQYRLRTYIKSYPLFCDYFQQLRVNYLDDLSKPDNYDEFMDRLLLGAQMVYGWMPRVFVWYNDADTDRTLQKVLAEVGNDQSWSAISKALDDLSKVCNDSLIGSTKILHFIYPELIPIFDAKLKEFLLKSESHEKLKTTPNLEDYKCYYEKFKDFYDKLQNENNWDFVDSINLAIERSGINCPNIGKVRAIELLLFLKAMEQKEAKRKKMNEANS